MFLFITTNNCSSQKRDPGSLQSALYFLALTPWLLCSQSPSLAPLSLALLLLPGPAHTACNIFKASRSGAGGGPGMEFQTKLALASYLLKGKEMSQAAAVAAQGEPEGSTCLLCVEGDGPDKQPGLRKGPRAPMLRVRSSRTLGMHKDVCRARRSWQHFATPGFVLLTLPLWK